MDPSVSIPTPDAIPVSPTLLEIPLILLFIFHLLLMNTVVGSCIIALFSGARTPASQALTRSISRRVPTTLALTINLGVAPLLFLQALYGQFFFTSSLLMASWWLAVVGILLIAYYGLYYHDLGFDALSAGRKMVLLFSTLLLLCVAFIFVNNMTLMLTPERWHAMATAPEQFFLNISDPTIFPRFLHFLTAAVAVAGLFNALVWRKKAASGDAQARDNMALGLRWFVGATAMQLVFGSWFLFSLPPDILGLFLGGSAAHTGTLALALTTAVIAVMLALKHRVTPAVVLLVCTVAGMAMARDLVRKASLSPFFTLNDLPVSNDSSSFVAFLVSLAFGAACMVYLVTLSNRAARSGKEA